jgi:hypothetical protein
MSLLPIMEKGKPVVCHTDWPLFYMNDFSRLGLVVTRLTQAVSVLEASGYPVIDNGRALQVECKGQLAAVLVVLSEHQVEHELSDLISCVYQG